MVVRLSKRNVFTGIALLGIALLFIGSLSIVTWEYTNSDEFCGNACHQVHPQESFAHQEISQHAQVKCVECHIGRINFFSAAIEKSGHIAHAWSLVVGYDRPTHSKSMKNAENSCMSCHPRSTTHTHNSIHTIIRFDDDEKNTEYKTTLIMRLMGRSFGREKSLGMNWHTSGDIKYRADDPQKLSIRWVEATLPDGSKRVYQDVRNPLDEQELAQVDNRQTMDCIDCHNRAGHPFPNPESMIDFALANEILSPKLPFAKKRTLAVAQTDFSTEEEAHNLVAKAWYDYLQELESYDLASIEGAVEGLKHLQQPMVDLIVRSKHLESDNIDWTSFPDHNGHRDGPGCFRCHNGRMQTAENTVIPVNCTTCHSIPLVTTRERIPSYYLEQVDLRKPRDHRDPAYLSRHMDLVEDSCSSCHGSIEYGKDDRSHCSNSGCHDAKWEDLDLDALRQITLE